MDTKSGLRSTSNVPRRTPWLARTRLLQAVLLLTSAAALSTTLSGLSASVYQRLAVVREGVSATTAEDPSSQWKDDTWPIREQTPWDISTDYPFPRKLEYDVTEGTWLRLDVHPKTGEIVFDMLGDLYCLPAGAYAHSQLASSAISKARPILLGVPHDSDPHFSPEGGRLVFRSDAGLGIENIWVTEWTGCENMDVRSENAREELLSALEVIEDEDALLASGVKETEERRRHRLIREGRLNAQRVTNETFRWVSDVRFHPSGSKVIATKWYTSSRSLGAGEGWEYDVPTPGESVRIKAGDGKRLVGRTLPLGWSPEQYGEQQIGPEQFIWRGDDTLIYSKNVAEDGAFSYSKDVHAGIYAIFSTNLTSKETTTLVGRFPGGASRPELSRDGRTLAFVRRVRDEEALVLLDLESGTIHHVWYGLTYDLSTVSAPMGTYPSYAFTPSDDAVIIWAAGQIYRVPLKLNAFGEKVAGGEPTPIRFTAHIEKRLAKTVTADVDVTALETQATQRVHAFTELRVDTAGERAVLQGSGATYVQYVGEDAPRAERVPALYPDAPYYSPAFVVNAEELVIHARWSDTNFSTIEIANLTSGEAYELTGLPLGRYYSPILCECLGAGRQLAFVKTGGDYLTGDVVATAGAGLWLGSITLPTPGQDSTSIETKNLHFVDTEIDTSELLKTQIRFLERNTKLLVQAPRRSFVIDLAAGPDEYDKYKHETLATGRMSTELVAFPEISGSVKAKSLAFIDFYHVYYVPEVNAEEPVWSKPANATKGLMRLSVDGGHDVTWSRDGKKLFWFLGAYLHWVDVADLKSCLSVAKRDDPTVGFACTRNLPHFQEVIVDYTSDIRRLKNEAAASTAHADEEALASADFFVIANATLLTMESGDLRSDILENAILVTRGGQIEAIVGAQDAVIPYGATVFNAEGAFIVPGFIDVHAHWNGFETLYPARSWELETFLAYGVTTLHNPSADNVLGFAERFRLERGQMVGPRIFQVGGVIYGAAAEELHQEIVDMDEARSALIRIKAEGGPASFSYKNYNLPARASRQRLLTAARELNMLCVPEGGMNYEWDLTYIVDGMTTIEHALPIPVLYDDVLTLFALSGTGSTPTHLVNYGGVMGEQYIWATEDLPNDPKLRRFTRHDILEGRLSESTARPTDSYALFNTSISTAKMVHKGLRAHIGAHGEPPLGLNYHAEMFFTQQGGLTNYEVIRAATSDAATTLGIYSSLGSLTPGKLADFVVYKPGVDLLEGDISGTREIRWVARGGRIWDAETMVELWPVAGRKGTMPPLNP